jgi:hypothetical protein
VGEIPGSFNAYGKTKRLPYTVDPQGQNAGAVHKCSVGLAAWQERRRQQEEKDREAGHSQSMPCPRCSRPIYWSYVRLSRNGRPLPIDDNGADEMHMCPFYTGNKQPGK